MYIESKLFNAYHDEDIHLSECKYPSLPLNSLQCSQLCESPTNENHGESTAVETFAVSKISPW